jgi:hypothetical protein
MSILHVDYNLESVISGVLHSHHECVLNFNMYICTAAGNNDTCNSFRWVLDSSFVFGTHNIFPKK